MKNKIDLRVLKTQEAIKQAFKSMLLQMPYEKITIKELCERALINRKTFYLHYSSIEDVLEEFQEQEASEYFDKIKDFDHIKEIDKLIKTFFLYSEEQGEFYEKIHCNSNYDYIHQKQTNKVAIKSQDNFECIRKFDVGKQNLILSYACFSIGAIYKQWIKDGKKVPVDEVIETATILIKSGIDNILSM